MISNHCYVLSSSATTLRTQCYRDSHPNLNISGICSNFSLHKLFVVSKCNPILFSGQKRKTESDTEKRTEIEKQRSRKRSEKSVPKQTKNGSPGPLKSVMFTESIAKTTVSTICEQAQQRPTKEPQNKAEIHKIPPW